MEVEGKGLVSEHGETSSDKAPAVSEHGAHETSSSKAPVVVVHEVVGRKKNKKKKSRAGNRRVLCVVDLVLRFVAVVATAGSAIAMGTTTQTLPFVTQFLRFKAQYNDLPALTYAMLALVASAASAIANLAHKGNVRANWFAICQQFDSFCERITGSLIGSFAAMALLLLLILLSAAALALARR
ncbi:hypothetical protein PR202_gb09807 [Eleusine coracana subsp. coracana]|uniref:CASP-like protein n=1 Tax=Eleusine coracana subsp. coracana TaxID=191504 RepID=A0AAV5EJ03_ELECO|nr:hypothetical protein PR202_gb09807 [Eleusine coracana subsp. coracana]